MLTPTKTLLQNASYHGYAVGAFNVYDTEGIAAVVAAAESKDSPFLLQALPGAVRRGGAAFVAALLNAVNSCRVPANFHLDHCSELDLIKSLVGQGASSVLADGSGLAYEDNVRFVQGAVACLSTKNGFVEAELGRLSGKEDSMEPAKLAACLTDPAQAERFVRESKADALAVCIGNVHGDYVGEIALDFPRLQAIAAKVDVPLVLHGASGLPLAMIEKSIELGVAKFNVNTEVRRAYVQALRAALLDPRCDLVAALDAGRAAMVAAVTTKLQAFGSVGRFSAVHSAVSS
jgi:tagatose 1,6-diphosphate aldolase GatY/KbaY